MAEVQISDFPFAGALDDAHEMHVNQSGLDRKARIDTLRVRFRPDLTELSYDNTASGLTATDPQAAIDEVEGRLDTAETNVSTKAEESITLTAGAGIAGGGDLTANRTFDVGAGAGITVNTDSIQFDTTFGDNRYLNTTNNLSDVGDVPTARTSLDVLSTQEVITQAITFSIALG